MRLKPFLYRKWSSYNGGKDKEGGLSRGYSLEIHDLCNFYFRLTLSISFLKLCWEIVLLISCFQACLVHDFLTNNFVPLTS